MTLHLDLQALKVDFHIGRDSGQTDLSVASGASKRVCRLAARLILSWSSRIPQFHENRGSHANRESQNVDFSIGEEFGRTETTTAIRTTKRVCRWSRITNRRSGYTVPKVGPTRDVARKPRFHTDVFRGLRSSLPPLIRPSCVQICSQFHQIHSQFTQF